MQAARTMPASAAALTAVLAAALALMAGCGRAPAPAGSAAGASEGPGEHNYLTPPELLGVRPLRGGRLELEGSAAPKAAVRLATPDGPPVFAQADASGAWRVVVAAGAGPRLLSLSMAEGGRPVWAMGYLFVAPDGTAVRLRSGGGSQALAAPAQGPARLTLDYDARGAATLTGAAAPGALVTLKVDGVERGQARAGGDGRFTLALNEPLATGAHAFDLVGPRRDWRFAQAVEAPAPLTGAPFRADHAGAAWRIWWLTPGGGEQATLVVGAAA